MGAKNDRAVMRVVRAAALTVAFYTCAVFAQTPADATIPLEIGRRGPLVMYYIEGKINGSGPYRLAVDVSVDTLQLSTELTETLGLDREAKPLFVGLAIAGKALGSVPAETFDPGETYYASDPPDAILGLAALEGWVVTLDIPHEQFRIEQGSLAATDGRVAYERSDDGYPIVPMVVDGVESRAQISLYIASTLSLPVDVAKELGVTNDRRKIGRVSIDGREGDILAASHEGKFRIGTLETAVTSVRVSEVFELPEAGYNTFQETPLSFDPANRLMVVGEPVAVTALEERAARVPGLIEAIPDLQTAFNAGTDHVQMILILAPT